jgi:hypothetical protein
MDPLDPWGPWTPQVLLVHHVILPFLRFYMLANFRYLTEPKVLRHKDRNTIPFLGSVRPDRLKQGKKT